MAAFDESCRRCLVRPLVGGEARVTVRPEHLALPEGVLDLVQERPERLADGLVVDVAVRLEPVAGVVRLDTGEPLERGWRPSPERGRLSHGTASWVEATARNRVPARISPCLPRTMPQAT